MAMKVRNDVLPYWTNIDATMLTARLEARVGGDLVPGAVQQGDRQGGTRSRTKSGIHQDGMLKHPDLRDRDPQASA